MNIQIEIKNVYGNELIYVTASETAKTIQKLTGRKTLTRRDIQAFKELGFTFSVYTPEI
jgi:histone H3/H4